jgi:hypothetical protein
MSSAHKYLEDRISGQHDETCERERCRLCDVGQAVAYLVTKPNRKTDRCDDGDRRAPAQDVGRDQILQTGDDSREETHNRGSQALAPYQFVGEQHE